MVLQDLNKEAADHVASGLRDLGVQTEVLQMENYSAVNYKVILIATGENVLQVIRVIREITNCSLKEANKIAENLGIITENISLPAAEKSRGN